jgi:hypothetical protein
MAYSSCKPNTPLSLYYSTTSDGALPIPSMFLRRKKEEKGEKTYGKGARRKETSLSLFAYVEIWLMLKYCEGKHCSMVEK